MTVKRSRGQIVSATICPLTCDNMVGVIRRYSNRPDLLEQLRKVAVILSDGGLDDDAGVKVTTECVIRSRRLRDRFSPST
jgi:hypothetical protein